MTLDDLKQIRLEGMKPEKIINLSLCPRDKLPEPVIHLKNISQDYRPLHGLTVDIHYWNRTHDAMKLIELLISIKPSEIFTINHKIKQCVMVYRNGESFTNDQSFLYNWEHCPYAQ